MTDISGNGLSIRFVASVTFPSGFTVTQFADDADPMDSPSIQLSDKAMTLNGNLVSWSTANLIPLTVNVIPDSEDDINLGVLAEANRVGRNKPSAKDVITAVVNHPDRLTKTLNRGVITDAIIITPVASSGRKKSKAYMFAFENVTSN